MSDEKLTKFERLSLVNQYRILAKLDPDEAASYERLVDIFEWGYASEYHCAFESFSEEMTQEEAQETMDTLEMYTCLQRAQGELAPAEVKGIEDDEFLFPGWDGNNTGGSRKMGFASLLQKQGRWTTVATRGPGTFNSHVPDFGQYDRMLQVWRQAANRFELTGDEVRRILAAFVHPDSPTGRRKSFKAVEGGKP